MVIEMETPEPLAETRKTEAGEAEDEVQSQTVKKLSEVMEPEETEEIHQALNRPAEAVIPVPAAGSTHLQTSIPFDHNECELSMAAMLELEKVSEIMLNYPGTRVHLCGHADATGTADYNLLLSGQRAGRIADYLEERGIDPHRIACEGRGESDPLARDRNADGSDAPLGRYLNRQVVVTLESPEPIPSELQGFYVPSRLKVDPAQAKQEEGSIRFTIQVCADFRPVGPDGFRGLTGVKEHICKDDYYRYTFGSYTSFQEARSVLDEIRESGYPDAFIQTVDWYTRAGL
jgi:outer membrane protein OmpA-like peptidoglycan-associated protein